MSLQNSNIIQTLVRILKAPLKYQVYLEANDKPLHSKLSQPNQGDPINYSILGEEASQDDFLLPDVRQVPRLQEDLVRYRLLE